MSLKTRLPNLLRAPSLFTLPHKSFLLIATIFGIVLVFLTPPLQVADEYHHYLRAEKIVNGQFIENVYGITYPGSKYKVIGGNLPNDTSAFNQVWGGVMGKPEKKVTFKMLVDAWMSLENNTTGNEPFFEASPGASLYSPILYLPQTVGIFIGKATYSNEMAILYIGRTLNLAVWITLAYFSIVQIPFQKWSFFLLLLTPMSLFQAASFSADALQNGLSFLSISIILKYVSYTEDSKITLKQWTFVEILSIALGMCKAPYFLANALFLLVPSQNFTSISLRPTYVWSLRLLPFISSTLTYLLWGRANSLASESYANTHWLIDRVDPKRQFSYLIAHLDIIPRLFTNAYQDFDNITHQFIGVLGWLDTLLPTFIYNDYLPILLLSFFVTVRHDAWLSKSKNAARKEIFLKFSVLTILIVEFLAMYLALYCMWTIVGNDRVEGVQGRYLIAMSPLLPFLFRFRHFSINLPNRLVATALVPYSIFVLSTTLITLCDRYYGGIDQLVLILISLTKFGLSG